MQDPVTIIEVGPRDGLQNIAGTVPTSAKIAFIEALVAAGARELEVTSFVNPAAVPQLADAADVVAGIRHLGMTRAIALVPNEKGFDRAVAAGIEAVAVFTASTDAFCQANTRCTIEESFARFTPILARAPQAGVWVRGCVSVSFNCPFSGPVSPDAAIAVAERLLDLGCDELSIADTIGTAAADQVAALLELAVKRLPLDRVALHFHDTHGHAVSHIAASVAAGVRRFDAAAGGLGGCPFAPGAPGNVATEAVVAWCDQHGHATGFDGSAIAAAATAIRSAVQPA